MSERQRFTLITVCVATLMLLLYLAIFAYRERDELRAAEAEAEAAAGSGSGSVRRMKAWFQHYDKRDLNSPTFKNGHFERTPRSNDMGDSSRTPRAREGEHAAMGGTSPLSVYISSEMNAGSSPEGTPASEISEPFEQRMEGAATSVEMGRPPGSQPQ